MNDDSLRSRIQRIDPVPADVAMEPATTPSSRERLEQIMSIDTDPSPEATPSRWHDHRVRLAGIGAAVAVAVAVVGLAVTGGDSDTGGEPLALDLGSSSALSSCLAVDAATLATTSPAFSGTATSVEDDMVTIDVDRWYAGGDADQVVLHAPAGEPALIDGFEFEAGGRYLITAAEGTVNFCGFSGPATPELEALFEEAFGS